MKETYIISEKQIIPETKQYFYGDRPKKFWPNARNFVMFGAGRIGKTTWFRNYTNFILKRKIKESGFTIDDFIENEELQKRFFDDYKFVLLTRLDTEVDEKRKEIFENFDGWTSRGYDFFLTLRETYEVVRKDKNGEEFTTIKEKKVNIHVGKFLPLNRASKIRGGTEFKGYKFCFWDEFMDENNKPVANEKEKFSSLIMTIFNNRKMECWFFSNYVGKDTTLFEVLDININLIKKNQQIYYPIRQLLVAWLGNSDKNLKTFENSSALQLLGKNSDYVKGRLFGEVYEDRDQYIEREDRAGEIWKPKFDIMFMGNKFGVYINARNELKVKKKLIATKPPIPLTKTDAIDGLGTAWLGVDSIYPWIYNLYSRGKIKFENTYAKEAISLFLQKNR